MSPLFLLGLILLLANDFYLKQQFHNYTTGKLSDFAGLFIFPFFISIFIDKPKTVYFSTALLFIFWKIEVSQPFIDFLSMATNCNVYRTIDITDLLAISILPFSYSYYLKKNKEISSNNNLLHLLIGGISIFAFCATTVPPPREVMLDIEMNKTYSLSITKDSLLKCMQRIGDPRTPNSPIDSLYYLHFYISKYDARIMAEANIKNTEKNYCIIKLKRIINAELSYKEKGEQDATQVEKMTSSDFDYYFKNCFINGIHESEGYLSEYWIRYEPIR